MVVTISLEPGKLTSIVNFILEKVCMTLDFTSRESSQFRPAVPLSDAQPSVGYRSRKYGDDYVVLSVQISPGKFVHMPLHRARWIRDIPWEEYPRI